KRHFSLKSNNLLGSVHTSEPKECDQLNRRNGMDCENVLKNTRQFRAKRSDHIDEEQHRKHNKQATRLWRQRLAYKEQLFDNIDQLKLMKTQAIESRQTAMRIARRTSYVDVVTVEEATHGQPQADFSEPPPALAVGTNTRLHAIVSEVLSMAKDRIGGTIVLNCLRQPSYDVVLSNVIHSSSDAHYEAILRIEEPLS
ncbi:hypothetical protein AAVH_34667, partial [Aphelenchoides avenae]